MKVENYKLLIDGGKSAMMTMRRRPLADRSRLELRQPEMHGSGRDAMIAEMTDADVPPTVRLRDTHLYVTAQV